MKSYMLIQYVYIEDYYKTRKPLAIYAEEKAAQTELQKLTDFSKLLKECLKECNKFTYPPFKPPFNFPQRKSWESGLNKKDITPEMLNERKEYNRLCNEYRRAEEAYREGECEQARRTFINSLPFSKEVKEAAQNYSYGSGEYGIEEIEFYP